MGYGFDNKLLRISFLASRGGNVEKHEAHDVNHIFE